MTTTEAVAAPSKSNGTQRTSAAYAVCVLLTAVGMAGCGSTSLLGPSDAPAVSAGPVSLPVQQSPAVTQSKVALAPIMGAPDGVGKDVGSKLGSSLERQRVAVTKSGERPDYTLRGYMVATKEKSSTKVSYIFDLTDPAGKRVNRIQGEEMAQGGDAKDPWSAVTPELAQRITDKTATSLATALSSLAPTSGGNNSSAAPPVGVGAPPTSMAQPAATLVAATGPTTGSIDRAVPGGAAGLAALVPIVTGAPGDGNSALADAMRQELTQAGIGSASAGQRSYLVAGKVTVGPAKDGKQPIKIDWRVTDPGGSLLATVSQNNEIQAGTLDGAWGNIAADAAQGAAVKIKTLIDENQASGAAAAGAPRKAAPRSKT